MKFLTRMLTLTVLVLPFFAIDSGAQSQKQQIEELKQQIEEIQRQNQQQIEELKQQIEMLGQAREVDKERIVKIEEENRDAWYQRFKAEYKKGLVFSSDNGNFKMRFRIRGQFQASVNDTDGQNTATNFGVARLRFKWDGYAFKPWFQYVVQFGARDSVDLRDMYFTIAYDSRFEPRIGQFKVPFGRSALNSSGALQFVTRSIVDAQFVYARDRGMTINGGLVGNHIAYSMGVFNGDGRNGVSVDSNLLYAGRIQLGLGGDNDKFDGYGSFPSAVGYKLVPNFAKVPTFTLGIAAVGIPGLNIDRKRPTSFTPTRMEELGITVADTASITADVNYKQPAFNIQGSYYGRWIDPEQGQGTGGTAYDQGFNIQAGVFAMPRTLEFVGRYSYIDFDTSSAVVPPDESIIDSSWAITPGINYYISHDHRWKVQLQYSFLRESFTQGEPDIDSNIVRAQLQAVF
jgi:hypothetical protein